MCAQLSVKLSSSALESEKISTFDYFGSEVKVDTMPVESKIHNQSDPSPPPEDFPSTDDDDSDDMNASSQHDSPDHRGDPRIPHHSSSFWRTRTSEVTGDVANQHQESSSVDQPNDSVIQLNDPSSSDEEVEQQLQRRRSSRGALVPPRRIGSKTPQQTQKQGELEVGAHRENSAHSLGRPSSLMRLSARRSRSEDDDDARRVGSWRRMLPSELRASGLEDEIAIAEQVDEEHEKQMFVPEAIEYDTDAKPPISKNRRARAYSMLFCVFVLGVVTVGIAAGVSNSGSHGGGEADPVPTLSFQEKRLEAIDNELKSTFGATTLSSAAYRQARDWLVYEDPMQLVPEDDNFVQRFTLALLYFQTSGAEGEDGWFSCGKSVPELNETEICSFYLLRNTFPHDYDVTIRHRWLSSTHECLWAGLSCNFLNQTSGIRLSGQNMTGPFPSELSKLTLLQTIGLGHNLLSGTIPRSISRLKQLTGFAVEYNLLSGDLPTDLYVPRMQTISLGDNVLTGRIPEERLEEIPLLKTLSLPSNFITGTIPSQIGMLSSLAFLRLDENGITGTLPSEIGQLSKLRLLWIDGISLSTTIPSEIGNLRASLWFLFAQGAGLKGTIPDSFYELTMLQRALLNENELEGTISSKVSQLRNLRVLDLHKNNMIGTIPSEIGNEDNPPIRLTFSGNHFEGSVPEELCAVDDLWADCLVPAPVEAESKNFGGGDGVMMVPFASNACECCTRCCEAETDICEEMLQSRPCIRGGNCR